MGGKRYLKHFSYICAIKQRNENMTKVNALLMNAADNVVTTVAEVAKGEDVVYRKDDEFLTLKAEEDIPYCHKVALVYLPEACEVIKYGESLGKTVTNIGKGCWVNDQNLKSELRDYDNELAGDDWQMCATQSAPQQHKQFQFWGYRRAEGRPGIRNHILILPTCVCASESCRIVASQIRGAVNIVFNTGCSDVQANTDMSQKVLTGFACHPNVYGVVIIGLGCETVPHRKLKEKIERLTSKPVISFGIQEEGGTLKTIEKATRAAREMAQQAGSQQKELFDASELYIGIECGGSDATSGIASNPSVGEMSDILVDMGATTVMSESIEWIGGEHILAKRAATTKIHNQIIEVCREYEAHLSAAGQDCRAGQPTPGNKAGGLSTLEEKSLGCIRKGGTRPIVEVLQQAVRPSRKGAVVMDTAGFDIASVTSMVASGCQAIVFTTGRGTPTGNAIAPVLKVTANERTYRMMEDNMDVDLSAVLRGERTIVQMGSELVGIVAEVASGRMTKAEVFGFSDIAVDHVCRFV